MFILYRSGFLPQNKTKLAPLFLAGKILSILLLIAFLMHSIFDFIPKCIFLMYYSIILFSIFLVTKILQGVAIYQNIYKNPQRKVEHFAKSTIYMIYLISLIILPPCFAFFLFNDLINQKLKTAITIFFLVSIVLFLTLEMMLATLTKTIIKKIQYIHDDQQSNKASTFNSKYLRDKMQNGQIDRHTIKNYGSDIDGYYYIDKNEKTLLRNSIQYKLISAIGILANIIDLSLFSINSIDFYKNNSLQFMNMNEQIEESAPNFCDENGINFARMSEEMKPSPKIAVNFVCYLKNFYVWRDK